MHVVRAKSPPPPRFARPRARHRLRAWLTPIVDADIISGSLRRLSPMRPKTTPPRGGGEADREHAEHGQQRRQRVVGRKESVPMISARSPYTAESSRWFSLPTVPSTMPVARARLELGGVSGVRRSPGSPLPSNPSSHIKRNIPNGRGEEGTINLQIYQYPFQFGHDRIRLKPPDEARRNRRDNGLLDEAPTQEPYHRSISCRKLFVPSGEVSP